MLKLRNEKGFTLIELIVIISIMSILLSISYIRIDNGTHILKDASKAIRDDLRYVRYINMTEGRSQKIVFSRDNYQIIENTKLVKQIWLHKDISIYQNLSKSQVSFSDIGAPSDDYAGTITIVNNRNKKYCQVSIVPYTGRILLKNEVFSDYKG